jgi:hypothetical protein
MCQRQYLLHSLKLASGQKDDFDANNTVYRNIVSLYEFVSD